MDGYDRDYIFSLSNKLLRQQMRANKITIWFRDENRHECAMTSEQMRKTLLSLRGRVAPPGEYGPMIPKKQTEPLSRDTKRNVFTALLMPVPVIQHPLGRVFRNE